MTKINLQGLLDQAIAEEFENITPIKPPIHIFPEFIRAALDTWEKAYQIKTDYLMMGVLSAASAAIGRGFSIKYKKGWYATASLYGVMVGTSSIGKSPAIKLTLSPILQRDKHLGREFKTDISEWKAAKENEEEPGEQPIRKHLFIEDATIESVVRLLCHNPKGLLLIKDELMSWINSMNKYRKGDDEQKWLSIHSGAPIKTHRQTVEEYEVESSFVSIVGGVQPGVINSFAKGDKRHNGFIPRLLFAYPESLEREMPVDIEPDSPVLEIYTEKILSLFDFASNAFEELEDNERGLQLTEEARNAYLLIRQEVARDQNENTDELVKAMLGKLEDYVLRFALIIELLDFIDQDKHLNFDFVFSNELTISKQSIDKAKELYEYFKYTALRVFDRIDNYDPAEELPEKKRRLYDSLPVVFTTAEMITAALDYGYAERTAKKFLKDRKLFKRIKQGYYYQLQKKKEADESKKFL